MYKTIAEAKTGFFSYTPALNQYITVYSHKDLIERNQEGFYLENSTHVALNLPLALYEDLVKDKEQTK